MDGTPITGVRELERHLAELEMSPHLPVNTKLLDEVELQLSAANIPLARRFLPKIGAILLNDPENPAVFVSLAIKLLASLSFTEALSITSPEALTRALYSPSPSLNLLAMAIMHRAAQTPVEAALLSSMRLLFTAFLTCWLISPESDVGEKGIKVLGDLLTVDCERPPPIGASRGDPGQGKLWRLLFQDRPVYDLLIALVSPGRPDMTTIQLSLAQGRLLRLLPRLAMLDFSTVNGGLLQFAALRMVDKKDQLLYCTVIDFFETFISVMRVADNSPQAIESMRALLREAVADDNYLRQTLLTLPDRMIEEEGDPLRNWIRVLMPEAPVRVSGWNGE